MIGGKITTDDFSHKVRYLFGDTIDLLGTDENPKEYSTLSLVDKFDVLYNLVYQIQYIDAFKRQVEKYDKENELRFEPIYEGYNNDDELESYYLLSDNRIYKQTLFNFPEIKIPKKYKNSKNFDPEIELANVEPEVSWECIAIGIYQIHDFLDSVKSIRKFKTLVQNIKYHINDLALEDLNIRKKIVKRKREQQLNELVNNRKRSSRLQQREEQLKIENEQKEAELEIERKEQAKIRAIKNLKRKEDILKKDIEERLKRQTTSRRTEISIADLKVLDQEPIELGEGDWLFECGCGIRKKNYDDGVKLIVCERCQRWQHLKCQPRIVQQELLRNSNDVFICEWCIHDFELEVIQKIEDDKIRIEKEAEEKQRQKELQKQREIEEAARLEAEEQIRQEEAEKEKQRRALEREQYKNTIPNVNGLLNNSQHASYNQSAGPAFGTFQVGAPQQFQQPPQQPSILNPAYPQQYTTPAPSLPPITANPPQQFAPVNQSPYLNNQSPYQNGYQNGYSNGLQNTQQYQPQNNYQQQ